MISKNHWTLGHARSWASLGGVAATMIITGTVLGVLALAAGVPSAVAGPRPVVSHGPELALGRGTVRTYVETVNGVATEVGVALTEAALEGLPTEHDHHGMAMPDGHMMFEYVLDFPRDNPTPYRHVSLNWNPGGHEPPGIYDSPHFDFHFQLISDAERRQIVPEHPGWEGGERHPDARLIPAGYQPFPPAVPLMGLHWLDPRTPELHGEPFTQTFIFGSWHGKVVFAEPMITKAFLEARPDFSAELPLPADLERSKHLPSRYGIRWDEASKEYRISLEGLIGG